MPNSPRELTFRSDEPKAEVTNIIPGQPDLHPDAAPFADRAARARLRPAPRPVRLFDQRAAGGFLGAARSADGARSRDPLPAREDRSRPPRARRSRSRSSSTSTVARPSRSGRALREGVSWWNQAFDAAGFVDAFRAEILPEGADPLDVRYNVVNWVNRATRGWSYGSPIDDPRTGEIIKGSVLLGSLRARQDMMIFQALVGAGLTGTGDPNDPITATLGADPPAWRARSRPCDRPQHNFAASTQGRYSVMDYPAPRVDARKRRAVAEGCLWRRRRPVGQMGDQMALRRAHRCRGRADPRGGAAQGLRFVADNDARPVGSGSRRGRLWDDGADPVGELRRMMAVRRVGARPLRPGVDPGRPVARRPRRAFVPIWLLDRYQVEAAAKTVGGVNFPYALNSRECDRVTGARGQPMGGALCPAGHADASRADRADAAVAAAVGRVRRECRPPDRHRNHSDRRRPGVRSAEGDRGRCRANAERLARPERLNRLEGAARRRCDDPGAGALVDLLLGRTLAQSGKEVGRRIATTAILALARVQRDAALSPTVALQLSGRLDRLADELSAQRGARAADWAGASRRCSRTARRSTRRSPIPRGCRGCRRECRSVWTRTLVAWAE